MLGGLALGVASFSYLLPGMAVFLMARTVHGCGWAAINTAGATIATESTPGSRRGEALGYFGMMRSLAQAMMPALGLWLLALSGVPAVLVLALRTPGPAPRKTRLR